MFRLSASAVLVPAAAVVLATAGCGGAAAQPESVTFPAPPSTDAVAAVTVECAGGVAGVQDRLEVQPDGTAIGTQSRATGSRSTTLTPAERRDLADAVRRAAAGSYRPTYRTTEQAADLFQYRIRIGTLAVSADELTIPAPLKDIVEALAAVRTRLQLPC
jgi:hypothetical protein